MTVREYPLRILMTHVRFCVVNTDPAASYNDDIFVLGRKISVISAEPLFISSFKDVGAYCFTNVGLSVCPSDGRPGSFRYYLKNCLSQSFYNYFICWFILVRTRSLFILFSLCQRSMWYRSLFEKKTVFAYYHENYLSQCLCISHVDLSWWAHEPYWLSVH